MAVSKLCSSTSLTSDRKKCFNDGYRIHHTSLGGKCFAAEAMNAAAPNIQSLDGSPENVETPTLSYPHIRMIQESERRTHQLPYPHLLE